MISCQCEESQSSIKWGDRVGHTFNTTTRNQKQHLTSSCQGRSRSPISEAYEILRQSLSVMPTTRRSQRGQRLSDFFPAIDAPSSIAPKVPAKRSRRTNTVSTPLTLQSSAIKFSSKRKTQRPETPTFNPEVHGQYLEADHSYDDDEFIKSVTFSAAKAKLPSRSTPAAVNYHDYEMVVDYDSDETGFAFSPVKFESPSAVRQSGRKIFGTPAPAQAGKAMWKSEKNCVEKHDLDESSRGNVDRRSLETTIRRKASVSSKVTTSESGSGTDDDTSTDQPFSDGNASIRPEPSAQEPESLVEGLAADLTWQEPILEVVPSDTDVNLLGEKERAEVVAPPFRPSFGLPRNAKLARRVIGQIEARSPRIRLTRAVSGCKTTQMLEQLPIPDYLLKPEPENTSKPKRAFKKVARLPPKFRPTIPQPFALSKAQPQTSKAQPQREINLGHTVESRQGHLRSTGSNLYRAEINGNPSVSGILSKKRKASDSSDRTVGLSTPAKRIRTDVSVTGSSASSMQPLNLTKSHNKVPESQITLGSKWKQRAADRAMKSTIQEQRVRQLEDVHIGLVPRTLYSPEKQLRPLKTSSVTKPAPFKFSTDARAARSPVVASPIIEKPAKVTTKRSTVNVPVLRTAPFIPKPSSRQATIAASPVRALPSRIQIRREFDKVAEEHAAEALRQRRQEEEAWAKERERRMEQRRGWQDQGRDAIEQWAKTKVNDDGKRDWID